MTDRKFSSAQHTTSFKFVAGHLPAPFKVLLPALLKRHSLFIFFFGGVWLLMSHATGACYQVSNTMARV